MSFTFIWLHLVQFHTEINFRPVLGKCELKMGWGEGFLGFGTWITKFLRNKLPFIIGTHWILSYSSGWARGALVGLWRDE